MHSDSGEYDFLTWRGLTFWGYPDVSTDGAYRKFEANSTRKFLTYRLSRVSSNAKKAHPSGWNLDIIRFDESKPSIRVSDHQHLRGSSFTELFSVMGVLMDEEENPNLIEYMPKSEFERIKRKWRRWMKALPDWLTATAETTEKRLTTGRHNK